MINYATILSNYDDRLTLLEWLKKVEDALKNASLDNVTITQDQPDEVYFTFVFADGTSLDSPVITLPDGPQGPQGPQGPTGQDGADGVSVVSASIDASNHLIIVLSSGLSIDAGEIAGMQNPMTARDDLILGGVGGAPTRIAKGNNYDVLSVNDLGHIVWRAPEHVIEEATYYSTDPVVLIGLDADGHATEVPASEFQEALDTSSVSDGTISKAIGFDSNGDIVKETPSSGGMANPMDAQGDIIYGGASGTPTKLARGNNNGDVLTFNLASVTPQWRTITQFMVANFSNISNNDLSYVVGYTSSNTFAKRSINEIRQVSGDAIAKAGVYDPAGIYDQGDYCLYQGLLYKANTAISGEGAFNSSHWDGTSVEEELAAKQDTLVSGTNIKTINGNSVLGSGDITISGGGMANPMDAQGDIIYGGASGTPTKLAKGTAGQVLTMNAGATAPEWKTPSGGGGTQLYRHHVSMDYDSLHTYELDIYTNHAQSFENEALSYIMQTYDILKVKYYNGRGYNELIYGNNFAPGGDDAQMWYISQSGQLTMFAGVLGGIQTITADTVTAL